MWDEYVWIVVVGAFMAFFMSFGIGANDVANAFATSIGSKTLTLFQATILAAIAEFSGALLLGRGVASTVKSGIVDADFFEGEPEIIMIGMLVALTAAGTWLIVATYFEMPVSTTHSIIGGLVGWGLVAKGGDAILWFELDEDEDFPVKGIAAVVISWVFSPVASGIVALFFFWSVRGLVLRHENSFDRAFYFLPVLVGITFFVNAFYVLDKGINKQAEQSTETSAWIAAIVAAVAALAAVAAAVWLKGVTTKALAEQDEKAAQKASDIEKGVKPEEEEKSTSFFARLKDTINSNDPHSTVETHDATKAIHDNAEKFDPHTEYVFRYLQVLTAFADSFAHGGNDVANAIGPFSAIYSIYRDGHFASKTETQVWVLVLGGAGIVLGLSTYGYHIIKAIGVKLAKITPSRGFAIELGSALIVVTGSYLGLPLSTTHCQVGATVFVGLLEGGKGVSWVVIGKSIVGWVFTLIVVGFLSAILMSLAIFTPNLRASEALANIRGTVLDQAPAVAESVRSSCPAATPALTAELDMLVASAESSANNTFVSRFPNRLADTVALLGDVSTTNFGGATVACSATPEVSEEAEVEE